MAEKGAMRRDINLIFQFILFRESQIRKIQHWPPGKKMVRKKRLTGYCPVCKSKKEFTPIVYGYPTPELAEKAKKGKVILGGCILGTGIQFHKCKKCGSRY